MNWNKGKHDLTFGFDLELDQSNIRNTDLENGSFNFTDDVSGLAMANFLLGYQHTFSQTSGDFSDSRENPIGLFANDKWKLSPRLTLDYGLALGTAAGHERNMGTHRAVLRPDAYAGGHSLFDRVPALRLACSLSATNTTASAVPDRGETATSTTSLRALASHGITTGTGKMSLRAGGGLFYYSRLPGLFLNDAAISAPFSLRIDLNDSSHGSFADRSAFESTGELSELLRGRLPAALHAQERP